MANGALNTALVDKAIKFAVDAHAGTGRRGKEYPYIIHPLEALSVAATITSDPEILAATALHDTVEDTDVTLEQLSQEFGPRVASLVASETDPKIPGAGWREIKQAGIDRITASTYDEKIVALADKLSNLRNMATDYKHIGDALWSRFHSPKGRIDQEWRFRGLMRAFSDMAGTDAYNEFCDHVVEIFGERGFEEINLDDWIRSGEGTSAVSYDSKDGVSIIKLYNEFNSDAEPIREYRRSREIAAQGIRVPIAFRLVTDGKRKGVEFKRIAPKKSFARMISHYPERLEELTVRFVSECKKLNSKRCNDRFSDMGDFFRKQLAICPLDDELKEKISNFIDSVPRGYSCVHGDMHIGNLLLNTQTDETWWIDFALFHKGNPMYDTGMMFLTTFACPDAMINEMFHITAAQMKEIWRIFVREYFDGTVTCEEAVKICAPYAGLDMVYVINRQKGHLLGFEKDFVKNCFEK